MEKTIETSALVLSVLRDLCGRCLEGGFWLFLVQTRAFTVELADLTEFTDDTEEELRILVSTLGPLAAVE